MKHKVALSLLAGVVLVSGCVDGGSTEEPQSSIHIDYLNVMPQDREIYSGGTVNIDMKLSNQGRADASLRAGEKGSNILTNYCPYLFNLEEFDMSGETNLKPDNALTLGWTLQQSGQVLSAGDKCEMDFRLPFNYSSSVYRQVQLKKSESVADAKSGQLGYESSSGPLMFEVATITPSGASPILTMPQEGEEKTAEVLIRMKNRRPGKGDLDIHEESLRIAAPELGIDEGFKTVKTREVTEGCSSGVMSPTDKSFCVTTEEAVKWVSYDSGEPKCNIDELEPIKIRESTSRVIRCPVKLHSDEVDLQGTSSILSEIQAAVEYTYIRDVPSTTIRVRSRG